MKSFLLTCCLILPFLLFSQNSPYQQRIDSLKQVAQKMPDDTNKVAVLDQISYACSSTEPNTGVQYGMQSLALAEKLKWKRGIAVSHADLAINYQTLSEHALALHHNEKALQLYEELGNERSRGAVLGNIGLIYYSQAAYPRALEYFFKALKIAEDRKDTFNVAAISENIGNVFFEQKEYDKTNMYYGKALRRYEKLNNSEGRARCMSNMSRVYNLQGDYKKALETLFASAKINADAGHKESVQINYSNIGLVYCSMKDFANALQYQFSALSMAKESGDKGSVAIELGNIGETYYAMARDGIRKKESLNNAVTYLDEAVALCQKVQFMGPLIEFSEYLSNACVMNNDYKKAHESYKLYVFVRDSIFSHQNKVELTNLETKRALDLKEKDIIIQNKQLEVSLLEAANKRKENVLYLVGLGVLICAATLIIAKYVRRTRAQRNMLREIAQIQSHDVRGPVTKLLGLVGLFNFQNPADPLNGEIIKHITDSTHEMDEIINTVVTKTYLKKPKN